MRVFKTRIFAKWARKVKLTDRLLWAVIAEVERGLVGVALDEHVYKTRVALKGHGKRGGARTIIAYSCGEKVFFVYGYAKNEKVDMSDSEKNAVVELACELLDYSIEQLDDLISCGELKEINHER